MTIQLKNNAVGFLSASVSATATLLVLQSGEGANFPALVPSQFFYVTLASASGATEIVKVTGRSGDSLTVQRGQENTTAMSFPALSRVELRVTAQAVYDVIDAAISGTTTAVSNIASVIAVAASIDSVNTVTSNLASVINVSNNIGDINLVENSLTNVNIVAANMADINAVSGDLAAVNAVADDIDDLVTNLEDIVAVGGSINSVVTVANNIASVNAVNSNSTNVNTVAGSIGNVNTVATNIAAVQTVSTNIASVNAVNSNSANVNTVAGNTANVNTVATNIASVNTAATNIVAIQTAPAQATAAANSASAAATSATNAANSASAAAASAVTAVNAPGTSGTSTTSLTIGTGSQTLTTQTGKAWVVGQFVTVASTASPTNFMYGQITAYNSGTGSMTVSVLSVGGSGTLASWTIGLGGPNSTLTDQNSLQPVTLTLPSIRPSLLLDFANSKKLDPRMTFRRPTRAAYYDGNTETLVQQNRLLQSQNFPSDLWSWGAAYPGALGSELITNGTFASGTTGWSARNTATLSVVSGQLNVYAPALYDGASQSFSTVVGKRYLLSFNVVSLGAFTTMRARVNGTAGILEDQFTTTGVRYASFVATSTSTVFEIFCMVGTVPSTFVIDDVSVKEGVVDSVLAPDGTATAVTVTAAAANATFTQSVACNAGSHTFSVWLRRKTGTGNIDITAHSGGTWVTQTITSSWARYTVTQTLTASSSHTPGIRIATSGDQIEVWGAQFEERGSATAYNPTTTAVVEVRMPRLLYADANVPRFDHDPVTKESLGLHREDPATNLQIWSEDLTNAAYRMGAFTIEANAGIAPDGAQTADLVTSSSPTAAGDIYPTDYGNSLNQEQTFSMYVRQPAYGAAASIQLDLATVGSIFTFSAGSVAITQAGFPPSRGAAAVAVGGGWWRISVTTTKTNQFHYWAIRIPTGSLFVWGLQLENTQYFPSSYISTAGATVTRSADMIVSEGANFLQWYNYEEGSYVVESRPNYIYRNASGNPFISVGLGPDFYLGSQLDSWVASSLRRVLSPGNFLRGDVRTYGPGTAYGGGASAGGVSLPDVQFDPTTNTRYFKMSAALKNGDSAASLNTGVAAVFATGTAAGRIPRPTTFGLGTNSDIYAAFAGHIRRFAYYPARLTNAQLQALTA